ncbi:TetR/AcrR family transcriptional regulator [Bdellovibrio bacteriovorus]|uniref:TetR/AcrR family transcriptional regulator n=1 Tax=Bdellovibrio bacteriovorus TaxID=959 RepID=UPI003AA9DE14
MDTRTRALDLGRHYLQTLGFNGFSFQTVADALGIRKASLHYYFASKEDLGMALIEEYQKSYADWALKREHLPAEEKMEQLIRMFVKIGADHKICPGGVLCADYGSVSNPMKKKLLQFHLGQKAWLVRTIKQGIQEKTFRKNLPVEETADLIQASIQGGLQVARIRGEMKSFKILGKTLIQNLKS